MKFSINWLRNKSQAMSKTCQNLKSYTWLTTVLFIYPPVFNLYEVPHWKRNIPYKKDSVVSTGIL